MSTKTELPSWMTDPEVLRLARHIKDSKDLSLLPILGDALEEAGCNHLDWVEHCHDPDSYCRQHPTQVCMVVSRILEGLL